MESHIFKPELQVKQLEERGFAIGEQLANDKCCGALIAMEGGRLLNRRPDLFYDDGLCTQKHLTDTPMRLLLHVISGRKLDEHIGNISRGLAACADERFVSEKQVRELCDLIKACSLTKEAMLEAMGAYSVALVQLHVSVVTDPSKTQLDIHPWFWGSGGAPRCE